MPGIERLIEAVVGVGHNRGGARLAHAVEESANAFEFVQHKSSFGKFVSAS
jgi:hypothetical protein